MMNKKQRVKFSRFLVLNSLLSEPCSDYDVNRGQELWPENNVYLLVQGLEPKAANFERSI